MGLVEIMPMRMTGLGKGLPLEYSRNRQQSMNHMNELFNG